MKVGIDLSLFTTGHTGGREIVGLNLLCGFHEMNLDESIVCFCIEEYVERIQEIGNFKIIIVPHKRLWDSRSGTINKIKREMNAGMPGTNKVGRFIRAVAVKEKIDVVLFADKATPSIKFPMKTAFITHDSSDFSALEIEELRQYIRKYRLVLNRIWFKSDVRHRDLTIAISDYDASIIKKYIPSAKNKIRRIYDPIEFGEMFSSSSEAKKYLIALNIAAHHKNVITLVKAFCEVADKVPYNLVLVGKKPSNDPELYEYIDRSKFKNRITFTGFVSKEELNRLIALSAIYVNPSLYEGFGMTPIEMMGRNVQTIVADCTASAETTLRLCRYYYPPKDYKALSLEIMKLVENPMKGSDLSIIADAVKDIYDYKKIAQEYWTALEELINL